MTELETLLLQQLEQQQHDSEQLANGLSAQLTRLQTMLNEQLTVSEKLRQELEESDRKHAKAIDSLTKHFNALTEQLNSLGRRSSE